MGSNLAYRSTLAEGVVLLFDFNKWIWTRLAPKEKLRDDEVLLCSHCILTVFCESQNNKSNSAVNVTFYVFRGKFFPFLETAPFPQNPVGVIEKSLEVTWPSVD
jgi:hypothetical protein